MRDNNDAGWQRQAQLFDELADLPGPERARRLAEIRDRSSRTGR